MNDADLKAKIEEALRISRALSHQSPTSKALHIVMEQLEYLTALYNKTQHFDAVPKGRLTLGVIAAREFDAAQPDLARLLYDIDYQIDHR